MIDLCVCVGGGGGEGSLRFCHSIFDSFQQKNVVTALAQLHCDIIESWDIAHFAAFAEIVSVSFVQRTIKLFLGAGHLNFNKCLFF